MKLFLTLFLVSFSCFSYSQVAIVQPSIHYVSKWEFENIDWMKIGMRVLFRQECTNTLPPEFPTGTVLFENVYYQNERFSTAVEFKDSTVVSITYYLRAKQAGLLKQMGYPDIQAHGSAIKGQWTYTLAEEKRRTTIVGDKKRIVVVQTR